MAKRKKKSKDWLESLENERDHQILNGLDVGELSELLDDLDTEYPVVVQIDGRIYALEATIAISVRKGDKIVVLRAELDPEDHPDFTFSSPDTEQPEDPKSDENKS